MNEHDDTGERAPRRFLALGWPAARRPWRPAPAPLRLGTCASAEEAAALAGRFVERQQAGFCWPGWPGVVRAWGWDEREIGAHERCDEGCGCAGPKRGRARVLIVEFEDEARALRPDVRLEREAWLAELGPGRALALSGCPQRGTCFPACAHCEASLEEVEAAWDWLEAHEAEVRAWEAAARRAAEAREAARC